ncbi:hypothetical protein ACEQPO_11295 [Bacillus sp. SL00103]
MSGEYFYLGMNLPSQDDLKYRFTSKTFKVYNASDVTIDPIDFDYSVTMYLTGKDVKIRNDATKEALTIRGSVSKKQKIIITRQYVMIDGKMADTSGRFRVCALALIHLRSKAHPVLIYDLSCALL